MKRYPLGDQGLGIVLAVLFLGSWAGQAVFQVWVNGDDWNEFWASTLENWQSEAFFLLTFVVLTAFFSFNGSPESKSSDDELNGKLDEIQGKLDAVLRRAESR
jgi:hypothetical protein